ncbi:hypothetical protein HPB51_001474 [Rhipicephalus microplus]|uniref:THAP-type domain-containing protein n=1 Tax=Rhipicephalus microplus TaxID=6941 RepID=A0A9J6DSA1_RHIMP|nr:hypothetical protein HPB51_001474 [Rhipicephalus microplus]
MRHFFRPPRDDSLLEAWHEAIARPDKKMNSKSRVCHIHFHAEDIMKEFVHNVNGELVVIPREKWALKEGAIPLIFPSYPKFLSKKEVPAAAPGPHTQASAAVALRRPRAKPGREAR